jgi:hypothetical protein
METTTLFPGMDAAVAADDGLGREGSSAPRWEAASRDRFLRLHHRHRQKLLKLVGASPGTAIEIARSEATEIVTVPNGMHRQARLR